MFGLGGKKKRLAAKRAKVQRLVRQKGIRRSIDLDYIDEGLLDDIIALGYISSAYYSQLGIADSEVMASETTEEQANATFKEDVISHADVAAREYSDPTPSYTPEPEDTSRYSSSGSSYSSGYSDSGGSSDWGSSDSGGSSDD